MWKILFLNSLFPFFSPLRIFITEMSTTSVLNTSPVANLFDTCFFLENFSGVGGHALFRRLYGKLWLSLNDVQICEDISQVPGFSIKKFWIILSGGSKL